MRQDHTGKDDRRTRALYFFDLENPVDVRRLSSPMQAFEGLTGLVVVDEVQRQPSLFELLRVLVDVLRVKSNFFCWVLLHLNW